jgi:hypothetical protein
VISGMVDSRSNAFVEAMNGLLQQAKRAARGAYFSDRGRLFQADRGRRFSAIVDAQRVHASGDSNVSQSSTISLK